MRTTKSLTISLPPQQLREMERTAKREHRTMSELVRESFRRYQQQAGGMDVYELVRQIAPAPPALQAIREEARRKGTDKLTMSEINREVAAVRRKHDKKKTPKRSAK
jgi:Arc/MetJ-type ribon-helix-helix transcriptional regulator